MTLAKHRNIVKKLLICFYEMFYRNFLSLNVLKNCFSLIMMIMIIISNSNWTAWSTMQGVIARVILKSDEREAQG